MEYCQVIKIYLVVLHWFGECRRFLNSNLQMISLSYVWQKQIKQKCESRPLMLRSSFRLVNFFKSELISVKADDQLVSHLANILTCKVGCQPTSYLGLPRCLSHSSKLLQNPVVERIEKRLASWKATYLPLGVRITLIQPALANLPLTFY